VAAFVIFALLNYDYGVFNKLLTSIGMEKIQWYSELNVWRIILPVVNFWKGVGYNMIIIYAALIAIDTSYYESAAIDGATKLQIITKITIPLLTPVIIMLGLIMMGKIFYSDFGLFYMVPMDSGILYPVTDVIDTYVYRSLRVVGDVGMSTAIGLYQSVVGLLLVMFTNWLTRKYSSESALF
jgi:putative aldouronate transport system permease protein